MGRRDRLDTAGKRRICIAVIVVRIATLIASFWSDTSLKRQTDTIEV